MKHIFIFIVSASLFFACKNKDKHLSESLITRHKTSILENRDSIERAINNNDTLSYSEIANHHLLHHMGRDFFYYALTMAYKNNYPDAYYHVFFIIGYSTPKIPRDALKLMDSKSRSFALYHLIKSHEMGYSDAIYELRDIFNNNEKIPSSQYYWNELSKDLSDIHPK